MVDRGAGATQKEGENRIVIFFQLERATIFHSGIADTMLSQTRVKAK